MSIAAEIIAVRGGGTGVRLSTTDGPIHPRAVQASEAAARASRRLVHHETA